MALDEQLVGLLPESCDWCPRHCRANRAAGAAGLCKADGTLRVARAALHYWEEPPISGTSGSGAVFFSCCSLQCFYCQNHKISTGEVGKVISLERLVEIFFELKEQGAMNINLVTPTQYGPLIAEAIRRAKAQGFDLPFVWNTSGFETVEAIEALDGLVDVYLTDFKYASSDISGWYSKAPYYMNFAIAALDAMVEQVGGVQEYDEFNGQQRMTKGVIVRHLLLPTHTEDSKQVVQILHDRYGEKIALSLMNQYTPVINPRSGAANAFPQLRRYVEEDDYEELLEFADAYGVENYFWQQGDVDEESFIPEFDLTGV